MFGILSRRFERTTTIEEKLPLLRKMHAKLFGGSITDIGRHPEWEKVYRSHILSLIDTLENKIAQNIPATHYPLPATQHPLPATHYPLPTTHYPLPDLPITLSLLELYTLSSQTVSLEQYDEITEKASRLLDQLITKESGMTVAQRRHLRQLRSDCLRLFSYYPVS